MSDFLEQLNQQINEAGKVKFPKSEATLLCLVEGETLTVRLIGMSVQVFEHQIEDKKSEEKTWIRCTDKGCEFCRNGYKRMEYFLWNVMDRKDEKVKVLCCPRGFIVKLRDFAKESGDPRTYDVQITRTGKQWHTRYQIVKVENSKPVEAKLKLYNIEKEFQPPPVELVKKFFQDKLARRAGNGNGTV